MKLKFKEVDNTYSVKFEDGVKIRPYLKIFEINDIVNQCLKTDNQVEREMIKICKCVEYCTNIDLGKDKEINGEKVYDLIASIEMISCIKKTIQNYNTIEKCIKDSENTYAIGKMFVDMIKENLKSFDMNKIQDGFVGLKEVIK